MKGPDLTEIFLSAIKNMGIDVDSRESRSGKVVYARIAGHKCYLRHANLSHGRYYFGFATKDMLSDDSAEKAILICGDREVEDIFVMNFSYLRPLIERGKVVRKKRAVYEEYQATIFPGKDYQITVTGTQGIAIDTKKFKVSLSTVLHAITS